MSQIVSSPPPDASGAKAALLATLQPPNSFYTFFFLNIKMGTSDWPVGMQRFFVSSWTDLTRSHAVIKENSSLSSIFCSKGSNKMGPELRMRAPVISSHRGLMVFLIPTVYLSRVECNKTP